MADTPKMNPQEQKAYDRALKEIEGCRRGRASFNLSGRGLTALPPEIGRLTALTALFLYRNRLSAQPPEIGQLTALTRLELRDNQLTSLPPETTDSEFHPR